MSEVGDRGGEGLSTVVGCVMTLPVSVGVLQVLPFYSCSLDEEAAAQAAAEQAQPPSEALAKVIYIRINSPAEVR